ncbi:MAG: hypothetical protein ACXU9U_04725 [Parachlamydiaceae bacterium]
MKVKITNKILSVPPYISTSWTYIDSLYLRGATLVVTLSGGETINVPGLKPEIIEAIFEAHAAFLEYEVTLQSPRKPIPPSEMPLGLMGIGQSFPIPFPAEGAFQFGISSIDGFGTAMQHNPAQADVPDLPLEVLEKIGAIIKIVAADDVITPSSAVANCNCPYCQISRVMTLNEEPVSDLPEVSEVQEASSEPWHIYQSGENQFVVVNRLDLTEHKVYLGHPVGCTCGKEGCEHLLAVLKS